MNDIWDTYVNIYPSCLSLYIFFYDLSVDLINQAVSLFRVFFRKIWWKCWREFILLAKLERARSFYFLNLFILTRWQNRLEENTSTQSPKPVRRHVTSVMICRTDFRTVYYWGVLSIYSLHSKCGWNLRGVTHILIDDYMSFCSRVERNELKIYRTGKCSKTLNGQRVIWKVSTHILMIQ
jgi:hypothetical protein